MRTHINFIPTLLISLCMGIAGAASAQSAGPAMTLDQAVLKVQHDTGGKVLSAESRGIGRRLEYRIKVLTPDGHVKVMAISSEASKNPASAQSTKNPPDKTSGSKERH
ncbi:PepSY domain-containing protein [Rhodanobacter ginsengisoli]|uniref:PepSY domain-containing protein n=1 Tax=Rhodanobacter ginsengisoli TaxID=418646 RepID=A0ABW0QQ46_9GAMM